MGLGKDDKKGSSQCAAADLSKTNTETSTGPLSPVWVFGYGSLIWKTNFPYQAKMIGHVKGYVRRFWQASLEHRGTPQQPGRVVTLVENNEGQTWGMAYKVNPSDIPEVMAYLNKRESGGYTTQEVVFHPQDDSQPTLNVLVYIATCTNPNYLGQQDIESLAQRIMICHGHSGSNVEYVLELNKAMKEIAPHVYDEHLHALSVRVVELLKEKEIKPPPESGVVVQIM